MNKEPVTLKDKQKLADLTSQLINEFVEFVHKKDVDTFDLRDIRKMILKNDIYPREIADFKSVFDQLWKVWPDS